MQRFACSANRHNPHPTLGLRVVVHPAVVLRCKERRLPCQRHRIVLLPAHPALSSYAIWVEGGRRSEHSDTYWAASGRAKRSSKPPTRLARAVRGFISCPACPGPTDSGCLLLIGCWSPSCCRTLTTFSYRRTTPRASAPPARHRFAAFDGSRFSPCRRIVVHIMF